MTREEQIERVREMLLLDTPYLSRWSMAERIVDALAQPVEVTDEMVERAYRAFLGSDTAYVPNRVGLRNMRAALCAALEAEPQTERKDPRD